MTKPTQFVLAFGSEGVTSLQVLQVEARSDIDLQWKEEETTKTHGLNLSSPPRAGNMGKAPLENALML